VLFDANVPRRFRAAEAAGFDAMITAYQNMEYQQNLSSRTIAVVVLPTNDWSVLKHAGDQIAATVRAAKPGSLQKIRFDRP
jgi:hypothetical protein